MTVATAEPTVAPQEVEDAPPEGFASICILSFERKDFLRRCITSVLETADYPFELIVHDDGSRDLEVRQFLIEMVDAGVISTLMLNPPGWNQGQGIALNRMFHMARGNPIVKMDQDMTFEKGWLAHCATILNRNYKRHFEYDELEPRIGALGLFRYHAEPVRHEEMFIRDHDHSLWHEVKDFVGSVMVIPRDAWSRFGPFEERSEAFAEDNTFKLALTADDHYCCGLTGQDFATNHGFGVGPSTLVVAPDTVRQIHKTPKVMDPR